MGNFSIKLDNEKIKKLKDTFRNDICINRNEYIDTFIQNDDVTISIYKNQKVVFQGKDAFFYASAYLDQKKYRHAGSDEVGTGDYFGPVVVCASIVEESDYAYLEKNGITDSKKMNDSDILSLGPKLMEKFQYSLLILDNEKYNQVHEQNNLNMIKAKMHNQAYLNLIKKGYDLPKAAYIDEFCKPYLYFEYLEGSKDIHRDVIFETKAEEKYPAVALSSVIARYVFLIKMKEMREKYGIAFHLGASQEVNQDAKAFISRYSRQRLKEVAKLHFSNTEKL